MAERAETDENPRAVDTDLRSTATLESRKTSLHNPESMRVAWWN